MTFSIHPLKIGSQLFINRGDTPQEITHWVAQMAEARLSLMRIFVLWDLIEPAEGRWDWTLYDAAFAAAEQHHIGVIPTLMSVSPPGWMALSNGPQDIGDLEDPAFIACGLDYVTRVVTRWKDSPALDSWILWNEPSRTMPRTAGALAKYRAFLRRRYEDDITQLNRLTYAQYRSFDEIEEKAGQLAEGLSFRAPSEMLNWIRFGVADLVAHLRRIGEQVRALDPHHPIHINPHNVAQCMLEAGQSIWREAEVVDFLGCSTHPVWHSTRFPVERYHQSVALFADLMHAATPHPKKLFWVTELQGGPTLFSSRRPFCPTEVDIRHWLWESFGSGARAVIYWCFNSRKQGYEAGEWSLLGQDGQPSRRLAETTRVIDFIDRHREVLDASRPMEEDVKVLVSEDSHLLGLIDGAPVSDRGLHDVTNPRNKSMAMDAVCGAYLMAADLGHEVGFINEPDLTAEAWMETTRTLLAPGCTALSAASLASLRKFAEQGGVVVADGLAGFKDADGALNAATIPLIEALFGSTMADVEGDAGDFACRIAGVEIPGWFMRVAFQENDASEVLGRWENGAPAATRKYHEQGQAIRIGTTFFQRYLCCPSVESRSLLGKLLPESSLALALSNPAFDLRLRRLWHPQGMVGILLNRGVKRLAVLRVRESGRLEILDENGRDVMAGQRIEFMLGAGEVKVLLYGRA